MPEVHGRHLPPSDEADLIDRFQNVGLYTCYGGGGGSDSSATASLLPLHPYAVDCAYYVKTGACKFGPQCRYNHPLNRDASAVKDNDWKNRRNLPSVFNARRLGSAPLSTHSLMAALPEWLLPVPSSPSICLSVEKGVLLWVSFHVILVNPDHCESVCDMAIGRTKVTEKANRATVEQAIDPRTRMILFKMLNRGIFNDINDCISTGKEANVYHATQSYGPELVIKVYKTSVMVFKDRDRYAQGDYRFRYGYCKHNPRKMVKTWAEKEMRNLMRLKAAGIRCPSPFLLRLHGLVMEFIGKRGWAAPRLKDAALPLDKLRESYLQAILYILSTLLTHAMLHCN